MLGFIKELITGDSLSYIITGALTILGLLFKAHYDRVNKTLKEAGEAMIVLSDATRDRRTTKEEIAQIKSEVRDVVDVWKKTPDKYKQPVATDGFDEARERANNG